MTHHSLGGKIVINRAAFLQRMKARNVMDKLTVEELILAAARSGQVSSDTLNEWQKRANKIMRDQIAVKTAYGDLQNAIREYQIETADDLDTAIEKSRRENGE